MAMVKISYMNAIRDGIAEEMRKNSQIVYFGEGVSERGGSYGQTKQLWGEFGDRRIIDTPISENGFTALAVGAAAMGMVPVVDIMFGDILCEIMSPLAQQAAKLSYMSNGQISVPMVIRSQGSGKRNGPHHSASLYAVCMHFPGIKVVCPGDACDAKGLIKTALNQKSPVFFCENKSMYAMRDEIPEEEYFTPFEAVCRKPGKDATVVSIGTIQYKIFNALRQGMIDGDIEVIDPRCLMPLKLDMVVSSIKKTGRLVICEDGYITCGAGAEIAARIAGNPELYNLLKAPIARVGNLNIANPYSPELEKAVTPAEKQIAEAINRVLHGVYAKTAAPGRP